MKTKNALKYASAAIAVIMLAATLILAYSPTQAQDKADSDDLAKFVALMQYIRSQPTPADVNQDQLGTLALLDTKLSNAYITGFITPFTDETPEQVNARLQSVPAEDRFTAVMVESYRLAEDPTLLDLIHRLMSRYYVQIFTTTDLSGADAYLGGSDIQNRADAFNPADYNIPAPSATAPASPSTQSQDTVDSDDLAKFVAIMQYIRSTPAPTDVNQDQLGTLALLDTKLSNAYITGFITPFTDETPEQVNARLQSVPAEDRFTAVMVESYRLTKDSTLLDLIHRLMSRYYVQIFTTTDLSGADAYLGGSEIKNRADAFNPADHNIPAPSTTAPPDTGTPQTDRAVLVALYNATDGENWEWNSNWLTDAPLDEWHGVTTNDDGRVTQLRLWHNRLTGSIPPELGNLSKLQWLELDYNRLTGSIPPELGNLYNLESLWLNYNRLTGSIPPELGNLSNLERLYLDDNQLTGSIPSELGNLVNLEYLSLHRNQLTGAIPSQLGNLSNLGRMYLRNNQLTGCIPNALGDTLHNDFSELGLSFCSPRASDPADKAILETFYNATGGPNWSTSTNWLSDTEPLGLWYGVATDGDGRVTGISLGGNQLSGPIPSQLGNLSNLERLALRGNRLSGLLPQTLTSITGLDYFDFGYNDGLCAPTDATFTAWLQAISYRSGPDCDQVMDRAALVALYNATDGPNWSTSTNWLTDKPFEEWYGVGTDHSGRVWEVWLAGNQLSGQIPSDLGDLSNLEYLTLRDNQLSGNIPSELGNLSNLKNLWLNNNSLMGSIPSELGNLSNLTLLELGHNRLSGNIPPELGNLTSLKSLSLDRNQLSGPIPTSLANLTNLEWLSLWDNRLTGVVPQTFTAITTLEHFSVGRNDGLCVPDDDTAFQTWLQAIAYWTADSCAVPQDRAALVALYNATDGPNWSTSTNWLTDKPLGDWHGVGTDRSGRVDWLGLWDNGLAGTIPSELGNLANLNTLDLGSNQLTGGIPSELGNLTNLNWLSLWDNQLTGALPQSLTAITTLEHFSVGRNSGLCVPDDDAFQTWQQAIAYWTGDSCAVPQDRAALVAFYNATDGLNWSTSTNWLTDKPLGDWHGVGMDRSGRVDWLGLWGNGLNGPIPSELGNLTNLKSLGLSTNRLSGSIPSELGNLSRLTYLNLHSNQLSGAIPSSLGNLTNLEHLLIEHNDLTGPIPSQLGNLTNLRRLFLHDNQLSGSIPPELGNLTNLQEIYLNGNQLTGCVPAALQGVSDNDFDDLELDFCAQ